MLTEDVGDDPLDEFDFWKFIVLDSQSMFCLFWNFFYVFCSIISSYMYGYMAAFGH